MLPNNNRLTAEQVRHLFNYSPETGDLTWRNPKARCVSVGDKAGSANPSNGARTVSIDDHLYLAHRIVWLYVHGELPEANISAKNGNYDDLRIENFCIKTQTETSRSRKGIKGVSYAKNVKKWHAEITRDYQRVNLGYFESEADARAAYAAAVNIQVPSMSDEERKTRRDANRSYSRVQSLWKRTVRDNPFGLGWKSFSEFARDVGSNGAAQCKIIAAHRGRIGPDNFRIVPRSQFDRSTPEGIDAYHKHHRKTHRDHYRNHHLASTFGITLEQFNVMFKAQCGVCAICGEPETWTKNGVPHTLSVDHCHDTGEIRDLLCRSCNNGIGHFKEDVAAIRKAADYLERHTERIKNKANSVPASNVVPLKSKKER